MKGGKRGFVRGERREGEEEIGKRVSWMRGGDR
jgi:hypothetical protein